MCRLYMVDFKHKALAYETTLLQDFTLMELCNLREPSEHNGKLVTVISQPIQSRDGSEFRNIIFESGQLAECNVKNLRVRIR